jgi:benzodiazapine receptor
MQSNERTDFERQTPRKLIKDKARDAQRQLHSLLERAKEGGYAGESLKALAIFAAATAGAAAIGASATRKNRGLWYRLQRKPAFQPPKKAFGPVWTGLYALIAASGYRVYRKPHSKERTQALALWGAQLALNTGWSVLFFGKKAKKWALADLVALLATIAAYGERAAKVDKPAALMMAPYMAWVTFAGALNEEIARLNP